MLFSCYLLQVVTFWLKITIYQTISQSRNPEIWMLVIYSGLRKMAGIPRGLAGWDPAIGIPNYLVITSSDTSLAPSLFSSHFSPSDHFPVFTKLSIEPTPLPPPTLHSFRQLHSIGNNSFLDDLKSSPLITNPPESLDSLLVAYNTTLSSLLDQHAPVITKLSKLKSKSNPWFTTTVRAFRSTVLKTSGNARTLLYMGLLSNLFVTNTID